ncbi:hypothetical protein GPJ56_006693 [Histomonas meleagridis]|uniref:uncharacterized protein n=1 Tax=Histomonas meleagridis TaxID=135588 RepID=UPI003559CC8C|nr:hypothetical protein GPJ56_006693 [Histomonas meleagridis]KAH0805964.1 hypothetical protein GO595_001212 [Histomonas meleagridis]
MRQSSVSNSLTTLLTNPNKKPSVKEVLGNTDLAPSILNESPELIDFFSPTDENDPEKKTKEKRLHVLTSWALTGHHNKSPLDYRYNRNACNFLSAPSAAFQKRIIYDNSPYVQYMRDFLKTKWSKKYEYSGHFQRMFESSMRYTDGNFIKYFEGLHRPFYEIIFKRIYIGSYLQLFVILATRYLEQFSNGDPTSLFLSLIGELKKKIPFIKGKKTMIKKEKKTKKKLQSEYHMMRVHMYLSAILHSFDEDKALIGKFQDPRILDKLFKIPRSLRSYELVLSQTFEILSIVSASLESSILDDYFDKYFSDVKHSDDPQKEKFFIYASDIFGKRFIKQIYPLFFTNPPVNDHYSQKFIETVEKMTDEEKMDFFTFDDDIILKKIIDFIPTPSILINDSDVFDDEDIRITHGGVLRLAQYITNPEENKVVTPYMESPEWCSFVVDTLLHYNVMMNENLEVKFDESFF